MVDGPTLFTAILGLGITLFACWMLGVGAPGALSGLFASQGARDWPTGVQEADAPHFDFSRRSGLDADPPWARIEELYEGPLR
jgi:hypothetical protein